MKEPFFRKTAVAGMMFMHPCRICGSERAHFGFDVELRNDKPGRWYCAEHKGQANDDRQAEQARATRRTQARTEDAPGGVPEVHSEGATDKGTGGFQNSLFD